MNQLLRRRRCILNLASSLPSGLAFQQMLHRGAVRVERTCRPQEVQAGSAGRRPAFLRRNRATRSREGSGVTCRRCRGLVDHHSPSPGWSRRNSTTQTQGLGSHEPGPWMDSQSLA